MGGQVSGGSAPAVDDEARGSQAAGALEQEAETVPGQEIVALVGFFDNDIAYVVLPQVARDV